VPPDLKIRRIETDHGHDYVIDAQDQQWPDGTRQDADLLNTLELPLKVGFNAAKNAVRQAGHKMRDARIRTALKFRIQAHNSEIDMRLEAGITDNSQAHKRVGRADNQRDALDGTRWRDAPPVKRDAPDALTKPQVTGLENRDALHTERDALDPSQVGRVPPYKGDALPDHTNHTQTTPLF
jgi:hypothetical protein